MKCFEDSKMQKEKDAQQVISYNYNNLAAETLNHRNTMEDIQGLVNTVG
jgi:hypothetical protein